MPDGILTPCSVARSGHWFRQKTAPCNVACGTGIVTVTVNSPRAAPCNVICGCGMTCHWIHPNVHHTGILHLVSISTHDRSRHVILYQSAKFYPNRTTLGRKKWRHVDFQDGGSAILDCRDLIMGFWKAQFSLHNFLQVVNRHRSSKLLSFWENRVLSASLYVSKRGAYWDRLCRDVVGRWSLVGWLVVTRVHCGQTVHPRPLLWNTNRKPYPRNSMVQLSTPWGDPNRGMGPPWGAFCQITLTSCLHFGDRQTDKWTNRRTNRWTALMH